MAGVECPEKGQAAQDLNAMRSADAQAVGLEEAILSTVAYRDTFEFPMTLEEIHRYLHWRRCSVADVAEVLEASDLCRGRLATDGQYYSLSSNKATLQKRGEREARAQARMQVAMKMAGVLAHLPHIRMVAITGSLAARNCYEGSDIDFFCVTTEGRMWQARALVLVAQRLDRRFLKQGLCANYFASTRALGFDDRSMYIAQELAQMVPVYGHEVYDRIRAENAWTADFLPNADGAPGSEARVAERRAIKRPLEGLYGGLIGTWLEPVERSRKMRRFNAPGFNNGTYSAFTAERTGHDLTVARRIEAAWKESYTTARERADAEMVAPA